MNTLISDLLTFSTVDSQTAPAEKISFKELVEEIVAGLGTIIQETHTVIKLGDLPEVMGNRAQLSHLVQNLLSNAIKFRNSRAPEIEIL